MTEQENFNLKKVVVHRTFGSSLTETACALIATAAWTLHQAYGRTGEYFGLKRKDAGHD